MSKMPIKRQFKFYDSPECVLAGIMYDIGESVIYESMTTDEAVKRTKDAILEYHASTVMLELEKNNQ